MLHIVHRKLITVALIFLSSWILGTVLIHFLEAGHPIGESYFNALYFTIITTATIGFGDLVPMTTAGKILTMCYAIFYVPLFLYVMTVLFQSSLQRVKARDEMLEAEMHHVEDEVEMILEQEKKSEKKRRLIAKK